MNAYTVKGGVLVTPDKIKKNGSIVVKGQSISALSGSEGLGIDLGGASYVYPSLINIHDHMRGNYLPRVGPKPGVFYMNWLPWDNDLKASAAFAERENLSEINKYNLSTYKSLFSGVTTLNDHFPHRLNREILPTLPIRAIQEYCIDHEASSFDLKWGDGVPVEHERAVEKNWPFITHLEEGFDPESMAGIEVLESHKALDGYTVLIHCIGFSDEDIAKVARAGAHVAWCPASNILMFNTTCKIRKLLSAGVNVSLGTDSTHTGSCNLLAEMQFARDWYRETYGEELSARVLTDMVTINPARAFRLEKQLGSLEEGKLADLLVMKARNDDPYENLAGARMADIELLTMAGVPLYGEERFLPLLGGTLPENYDMIEVDGRRMFMVGHPSALYKEVRAKVGFRKVLDYLPFEPGA